MSYNLPAHAKIGGKPRDVLAEAIAKLPDQLKLSELCQQPGRMIDMG